jgi:hypothetical protein
MTMESAAAMIAVSDAKDRVFMDPSLNLWDKVKSIEIIDRAAAQQPASKPWITPTQVMQGAIGAGVGLGIGAIAARWLGVSDSTASTMKTFGAGLGTLLNMKTGTEAAKMKPAELIKLAIERDVRNAVRLGFLEGARASGLIDHEGFCKTGHVKEAASFLVDPTLITAPIKGITAASSGIYGGAGTMMGHVLGEDDADEDIERTMVEKRLLEQKADQLKSQRTNRILSAILAKRTAPKHSTRF